MINPTHVCALVLGLSIAPISQASPYYTNVTNEWWQGRQTNVLAMAESRLAANTNDIAGLLMKASYDFDFANSSTLSNTLVRVLAAGALVTTPAFTNAFRLTSIDIQWTFKTLESEAPAEHATDMLKVTGPGHPMAYSDELKALDDDGYFNTNP